MDQIYLHSLLAFSICIVRNKWTATKTTNTNKSTNTIDE